MNINSDINILGGLPDWNLINVFLKEDIKSIQSSKEEINSYTAIKTDKSVKRFKKAITGTLLNFNNDNVRLLFRSLIETKGVNSDLLIFLFWNASVNNELLHYLNEKVFFPALYTGRISIKNDEVTACIKELKSSENDLQGWSESTITTTASKYLTLLKKFGLMEGSINKIINHPYLSDEMFVVYIYWLIISSNMPNLLKSKWLPYSFTEFQPFLDRLMQKKFFKYFNVIYIGDNLNVEPLITYEKLYDSIHKS
ncbi:hypothetical protein EZS27_004230 [termite gut metagenome]|uniref:DUF1819 domain-containing protein n=1 Tax=termite gut metagenome TaxID=433724 RepID=A0A5J4SSV3_9ZZZZ